MQIKRQAKYISKPKAKLNDPVCIEGDPLKFQHFIPKPLLGNRFECNSCTTKYKLHVTGVWHCQFCRTPKFDNCSECYLVRQCNLNKHQLQTNYLKKQYQCTACKRQSKDEVTGCPQCEYQWCLDCSQHKLCENKHRLNFHFTDYQGSNNMPYQCYVCKNSHIFEKGVWRCLFVNCYLFKCPSCYGRVEKQRQKKIEDKIKNRRKRLFDGRNRKKKKSFRKSPEKMQNKKFIRFIRNDDKEIKKYKQKEVLVINTKQIQINQKNKKIILDSEETNTKDQEDKNQKNHDYKKESFKGRFLIMSLNQEEQDFLDTEEEEQREIEFEQIRLNQEKLLKRKQDKLKEIEKQKEKEYWESKKDQMVKIGKKWKANTQLAKWSNLKISLDQRKQWFDGNIKEQPPIHYEQFYFIYFFKYLLIHMIYYFVCGPLIFPILCCCRCKNLKVLRIIFQNLQFCSCYQIIQWISSWFIIIPQLVFYFREYNLYILWSYMTIGPFLIILYNAIIQASIYATMDEDQIKEFESEFIKDQYKKEKLGSDINLNQRFVISNSQFVRAVERNDIDLIIQWMKFFIPLTDQLKYDIYDQIHLFDQMPNEKNEKDQKQKKVKIKKKKDLFSKLQKQKSFRKQKTYGKKIKKNWVSFKLDTVNHEDEEQRRGHEHELYYLPVPHSHTFTDINSVNRCNNCDDYLFDIDEIQKKHKKCCNCCKCTLSAFTKTLHKIFNPYLYERKLNQSKLKWTYQCQQCKWYCCKDCWQQHNFYGPQEKMLLTNLIMKSKICVDSYSYQDFEEIIHQSSNVIDRYQSQNYMHSLNISKFISLKYFKPGTTTSFDITVTLYLIIRMCLEIVYFNRIYQQFNEQEDQIKIKLTWSVIIIYLLIYMNNLVLTVRIYKYLKAGIESLSLKFKCLIQFSNMLSLSDQQYDWQEKEKYLPTIDFLDVITITSYGKMRKILLDLGKRYIYRVQCIFSTIFCVSFLLIVSQFILILKYYQSPNDQKYEGLLLINGLLISQFIAPFLLFLFLMILLVAKLNGIFGIQHKLLTKLKFLIRSLLAIPTCYYFDELSTKYLNSGCHNEVIYEVIQFIEKKILIERQKDAEGNSQALNERIRRKFRKRTEEEIITSSFKNLIKIYSLQIEQLIYDEKYKPVTFIGIPITQNLLIQVVTPLGALIGQQIFSFIEEQFGFFE